MGEREYLTQCSKLQKIREGVNHEGCNKKGKSNKCSLANDFQRAVRGPNHASPCLQTCCHHQTASFCWFRSMNNTCGAFCVWIVMPQAADSLVATTCRGASKRGTEMEFCIPSVA